MAQQAKYGSIVRIALNPELAILGVPGAHSLLQWSDAKSAMMDEDPYRAPQAKLADQANFDPYAMSDVAIQAPPDRLWPALKKIGPGIIVAGSIIGSGELLLTTSLGAEYGFVFLWLILFSCVIKVFVQIELGRYALSSGKPTLAALDELPGPRFGAHWLVWWWIIMLMATVFQLGAMVGGVGQALNLAFPKVSAGLASWLAGFWPQLSEALKARPEHPWAVFTAAVAIALLLSGGYQRIERVTTFLVAGVTLMTVTCVALLPSMGYPIGWGDLETGFSLEVMALPAAAVAAAFGAFGITGVGASELYSYPYWCLEKGYGRFTGPRTSDPEWATRSTRLDARDVSRRVGEHDCVHGGHGCVLSVGRDRAPSPRFASRKVADDRNPFGNVCARLWGMDENRVPRGSVGGAV